MRGKPSSAAKLSAPRAMPHRIFLTGGTGFLGSHFLRQALLAGHEVFALRRPGSAPKLEPPTQPHWLDGKLTDDWTDLLRESDCLVHFAAAGVSMQEAAWSELFQINVLDSLHLWRAAALAGVRRLIISGSCFEYGSSGSQYDFIPANAPLMPTTAYGASKAAATVAALGLAVEQKLELLVLRPFHLFGEGEGDSRLWPSLRKAAIDGRDFPMTLGEQTRDFIPVESAAVAFLASLDRTDLTAGVPQVENLGSGQAQSLLEFATFWWKHWQASGKLRPGELPYRADEVMRYVARSPR